MTNLSKARRVVIELGNIPVDGFQMPNSDQRYSGTSAAEAIGKDESSFRRFLVGKSPEALSCKGKSSGEKVEYLGHNVPISAYPSEVISAYWSLHARKGNRKAIALSQACMAESLDRRMDSALKITRTEAQIQATFVKRFTFVEGIDFEDRGANQRHYRHFLTRTGGGKVQQFLMAFYAVYGLPWEGEAFGLPGMAQPEYSRYVADQYMKEIEAWDGESTPPLSLGVLSQLAEKARRIHA